MRYYVLIVGKNLVKNLELSENVIMDVLKAKNIYNVNKSQEPNDQSGQNEQPNQINSESLTIRTNPTNQSPVMQLFRSVVSVLMVGLKENLYYILMYCTSIVRTKSKNYFRRTFRTKVGLSRHSGVS